jgi:hypothetical protein
VILLVDRTFKLSLAERLSLGSVLPKEGDISTVRVLLKRREEIFLSSEEIEKYDVKASMVVLPGMGKAPSSAGSTFGIE